MKHNIPYMYMYVHAFIATDSKYTIMNMYSIVQVQYVLPSFE